MPELPEVVTVCEILNRQLQNQMILNFQIYYAKLLLNPSIEVFKTKVQNQKIARVYNQAKYIIFELEDDLIISHLRMEGRWAYEKPEFYSYNQELLEAQFELENGYVLRYYDFRRFGTLELISKADVKSLQSPVNKIGPQANDPNLTVSWWQEKCAKIRRPIKTVLLDQSLISGIGNIYANEILYVAKINPHLPANQLTAQQVEKMLRQSRIILNQAIKHGGTTIHSFAPQFGDSGGYQNFLLVHGKNNQNCSRCGAKIVKEMLGGRGTYYCPICQN